MEKIRLGTIGSGVIVESVLDQVVKTEGVCLTAVYSRSREKGETLAEKYGAREVYTDLDAFFREGDFNCVYIASPNSLHYPQTKQALLAGKHVWCEKPFCATASQARELYDLAREKGLMLAEAVPTAYYPIWKFFGSSCPKSADFVWSRATTASIPAGMMPCGKESPCPMCSTRNFAAAVWWISISTTFISMWPSSASPGRCSIIPIFTAAAWIPPAF